MLSIDILDLIPQSLKQQAMDTLVDLVSGQARKYASDELAAKIKRLRSDAAFNQAFEEGLERAARRFVEEYEVEDEDLVAAIAADEDFFKNEEIQAALLAILKKPGVYLVDEREKIAQSFDSVLPGRKNRERVDRAVMYLLKCLVEELWHLPELQPIYSLQFQRMTAEATRQQVDLQKAQLAALSDLNAGVREALLQLTDAIAERKLLPAGEAPILPVPSHKPKVYHNLPQPDYGRFVGRERELAQVARILRPYPHSQEHLVTIDGIGGIGKSALALEVAHRYLRNYDRIPPEERFEAIIWASAKQTVLTAEGILPRSRALRTLDDIYATIAVALQREDITRARPEEQAEVVRYALTRQRTLLIVDNLETIDDEAVMTFLRELPAPTKAIVTTRHRIDVAYPVRLVGMPWEDAHALIEQECVKKGVTLNEDEARRLYHRTGGVPLAIVWSIAQMGFGYSVESMLTRLGQPASDIARFCFEEALECIQAKPAYKLLMALSLFATDASRDALGYITDLPELDRDEGLVELEKLSVVNKAGTRFSILPMTRQFALWHLTSQAETEKAYRRRQTEYYRDFIGQRKLSSGALDLIREEHSNIAALLDFLVASGEFPIVVEIFNHYYPFLWRQGYWSQGIKLTQLVFEWAETNKREDLQARCNHWLGRLYLYQGQYLEAERHLSQAARQYSKADWQWISVQTYLGQVLLRQGRLEEARQTLEKALPVALERKDYRGATRLHNAFVEIEITRSDWDAALQHLNRGYELAHGRNEQTTVLGQNFHLRGIVERIHGQFELAQEWITKFKEIADREGFVQESAQADLELARIAEQRGAREETRQLAENARGVFERLGVKEDLGECIELLRRL